MDRREEGGSPRIPHRWSESLAPRRRILRTDTSRAMTTTPELYRVSLPPYNFGTEPTRKS